MESGGWFNYGQVEVAVGVGPGVRVGVNFVEIVDFIVGFVGIDLCGRFSQFEYLNMDACVKSAMDLSRAINGGRG